MTTNHQSHFDRLAQRTHLRELAAQRKTCQGCHWLQTWPRPMCKGEGSAHYRMVRDTYHERCDAYAVQPAEKPPAPKKERVEFAEMRGRNMKQRVRA